MRFVIKCFMIALFALAAGNATRAAVGAPAPIGQPSAAPADIEAFVRDGCPHCAKAKEFLSRLQQEQPDLRIAIRDVGREPAALERLKQLAGRHATTISVPAFVIGGQMIVGFSDEASTGRVIRNQLAAAHTQERPVDPASNSCAAETSPPCGSIIPFPGPKPETFSVSFLGHRLTLDQIGLPLFTLVMGLLDGFNPCSMWVLILMLSLLAAMNDRARMFAIAGTFVAVQGIAYFAFMAAWLNIFLLIGLSRASEIIIAVVALLAGAVNVKDFWNPDHRISLAIPASAKPGIYARMRRVLQARNLAAALAGAVVLAVLVQLVELMCTSGFPALFTRILTLRQLDSLSYYGYLLLYDAAYMFDDMIVLAIGIVTLNQHRLQEKEGRWLKLVSGLFMVGLGIYLLRLP